jgi:hypothetical protein
MSIAQLAQGEMNLTETKVQVKVGHLAFQRKVMRSNCEASKFALAPYSRIFRYRNCFVKVYWISSSQNQRINKFLSEYKLDGGPSFKVTAGESLNGEYA